MKSKYFNGLEAICAEYIESNNKLPFGQYVRCVALYHEQERWSASLVGETRELTEDEIDEICSCSDVVKFVVVCDDGDFKTQDVYETPSYIDALDYINMHNVIANDNTKAFAEFKGGTARVLALYHGDCLLDGLSEQYYDIVEDC